MINEQKEKISKLRKYCCHACYIEERFGGYRYV